jgi:hypothetical protein
MAAKYLPTIKDRNAAQRFQQKQGGSKFFQSSSGTSSGKKTDPVKKRPESSKPGKV